MFKNVRGLNIPPLVVLALKALVFASVVASLFYAQAQAANFGKLAGEQFGSGNQAVVVVLHGDVSKGGPANYHYKFAKSLAKANKGVTTIALLRPGYSDGKGNKSGGSNSRRRDHYTKTNNDLVASALKSIKATYKPRKLIVVGHSGGAAQTGVIIGRYPGLINTAVLVSCPCDIAKWRKAKNASEWPKSQSPHKYVRNVPRSTRIYVVNGSRDSNTKAKQAQEYVALAKSAGLPISYHEVRGAEHGFNRQTSQISKIVKAEVR